MHGGAVNSIEYVKVLAHDCGHQMCQSKKIRPYRMAKWKKQTSQQIVKLGSPTEADVDFVRARLQNSDFCNVHGVCPCISLCSFSPGPASVSSSSSTFPVGALGSSGGTAGRCESNVVGHCTELLFRRAVFLDSSDTTGERDPVFCSDPMLIGEVALSARHGIFPSVDQLRSGISRSLSHHGKIAAWKHRNLSHVEQEGLAPMPKDRGVEQGDVDGPLEYSLALGMVAAETRERVAVQHASGSLPRIGVDSHSDVKRLQTEHAVKLQETANFQLGGPEKLIGANEPRHVLQKNGGLADLWYMDDGDILCHPILVLTYLQEFAVANARIGVVRNPQKTEVIYNVIYLDAAPPEWRIGRNMAKVSTVTGGSATLGVAVGPRQFTADQLSAKADVTRAMHEQFSRVRTRTRNLPHQPHPARSPHNFSGTAVCSDLRRGWGAVSRPGLPGFHGTQYDASHSQRRPVRSWVQQSARHRGSGALGCNLLHTTTCSCQCSAFLNYLGSRCDVEEMSKCCSVRYSRERQATPGSISVGSAGETGWQYG